MYASIRPSDNDACVSGSVVWATSTASYADSFCTSTPASANPGPGAIAARSTI
ncbi:hypothetical protein [Jiangella gansuensis]|uniref:hypothetical protein n=1 Tax=Jiangella gansuensis TaxID=281473 RepID=UPI0012F960D4|nr:hypothetical protein [Jiangella gansuensis]